MFIFCQSFISENMNDHPRITRQAAIIFANEVNVKGDVISISETAANWGNSVTVWYKSMKKVEV